MHALLISKMRCIIQTIKPFDYNWKHSTSWILKPLIIEIDINFFSSPLSITDNPILQFIQTSIVFMLWISIYKGLLIISRD